MRGTARRTGIRSLEAERRGSRSGNGQCRVPCRPLDQGRRRRIRPRRSRLLRPCVRDDTGLRSIQQAGADPGRPEGHAEIRRRAGGPDQCGARRRKRRRIAQPHPHPRAGSACPWGSACRCRSAAAQARGTRSRAGRRKAARQRRGLPAHPVLLRRFRRGAGRPLRADRAGRLQAEEGPLRQGQ